MTPVTPATYTSMSQANINEFLKAFFDGNAHTIGSTTYTFPACAVKFGRRQLTQALPQPLIIVENAHSGFDDRVWAGTTKSLIRKEGHWRFVVATRNQNVDDAPNWQQNDIVTDLLNVVLDNCRNYLAQGGQRIIKVGNAQKFPDPDYQFQAIPVVIRCDMQHDNFVAP